MSGGVGESFLDKTSRGLDLQNLEIVNKALTIRLLWDLTKESESLWIKWIHQRHFQTGNLWEFEVKGNVSWPLKSILPLRVAAGACLESPS